MLKSTAETEAFGGETLDPARSWASFRLTTRRLKVGRSHKCTRIGHECGAPGGRALPRIQFRKSLPTQIPFQWSRPRIQKSLVGTDRRAVRPGDPNAARPAVTPYPGFSFSTLDLSRPALDSQPSTLDLSRPALDHPPSPLALYQSALNSRLLFIT